MKGEELVAIVVRYVRSRLATLEICPGIFILPKHFEAFKLSATKKGF
jgi:hypothetical protein